MITVEDQGPGVPEDKLEQIFERYYSERGVTGDESALDPGEAHFGIGLWIVRRNVEAIGGSVAAENGPGGGLRVRLRLPSV